MPNFHFPLYNHKIRLYSFGLHNKHAGMNNYEVVGLIGEGAYGVVLKAKHKDSGANVAIKKFKETDDD